LIIATPVLAVLYVKELDKRKKAEDMYWTCVHMIAPARKLPEELLFRKK
jgi:hypothetical protein